MDLSNVVFAVGTLLLVAFVCTNAYVAAAAIAQGRLPQNLLFHPLEVVGRFGFIGICLLLAGLSGLPPAAFGWVEQRWVENIAVGLALAIVLQEINHRGTLWAIERFGPQIYRPDFLRALIPRTKREWALAPLALLPAAAGEELLFRSLAIGGLSVLVDAWLLAIVFSVVFGIAHLPQGKLGVVGAAALGLCLSALFLWRWSAVACIVAHYGVNVVQLWRAPAELRRLDGD